MAGGFGRQILGETWIDHHGHHGFQSTRGVVAKGMEQNPIVRGCDDIWCPTDVYEVRLPLPGDCRPLVLGQVLEGMKPSDKPIAGPKNDPLMPVAWTKPIRRGRNVGRVFTTTMGSAQDFQSEGCAACWSTPPTGAGLEEKIPAKANVDLVGQYHALPSVAASFARAQGVQQHPRQPLLELGRRNGVLPSAARHFRHAADSTSSTKFLPARRTGH